MSFESSFVSELLESVRQNFARPASEFSPGISAVPVTQKVLRDKVLEELTKQKIGTRLLFGVHLLRQPAYAKIERRVASSITVTDQIMTSSFWVGVHPGLIDKMVGLCGSPIDRGYL